MKTRRSVISYALAAPLSAALPQSARAAKGVELALIVRPQSSLQELSLSSLRHVFLSAPVSEPNGDRLVPYNHPLRAPDRVAFDRLVLRLDPEDVARLWLDRKIRGQPNPPRTVDSLAALLRAVATVAGAIGYIRAGFVTKDVRVIKIEGRLPGQAGYPLIFAE